MEVVTSTLVKPSEANLRPQNSDILPRQQREEVTGTGEGEGRPAYTGEAGVLAPNAYMMLISRIDNMIRKGRPEPRTVEQLARLLGERVQGLMLPARRHLEALPEVQALRVNSLRELPAVIAAHLEAGTESEALLALLRSPAFAAAMKDESRTATYGPHGMLRAS
jgi:hypothetical protein